MKKKIYLLSSIPGTEEYLKYGGSYIEMSRKTAEKAKQPDTELIRRACPPGFWKARHTTIDYLENGLMVPTICKTAINAEKEGADAIIVTCTNDPGLRFLRQLLDIPVVAEFESTMHVACMMGYKFGVLSWPIIPYMKRGEQLISEYGLQSHAIAEPFEPVIEPGPKADIEIIQQGYSDPKAFAEKHFIPAARRLIKRGAEAIIMHSTGLSLIAENAGLRRIEAGDMPGVPKGAAVPLLENVTVPIKMAELMIDLYRSGIPSVGRVGLYQKVDQLVKEDDLKQIREAFEKDWQPLPMPKPKKK
ncbi:MAG: hypothetical protein JW932_09075 [Deltaproteobacteria bacterium]|nr:hypothetical protein [Deltaproteobacteria bacterium]